MGKLLVAVVIGLCAFTWRIYEKLDVGRTVYTHRPGVCKEVVGPVLGSEDVELVRSDGIAFISSGVLPMTADNPGKMFLYDFNQKRSDKPKATELPIKGSFDQKNFHPHGLTHWVVGGLIRLYAISHDNNHGHSVEVFEYDPAGPALNHIKTFKHKNFIRPNDLVAVGPDKFIFTNDGSAQSDLGFFIEHLFGYNGGSVHYFDGNDTHELVTMGGAPNGVTYDADKNKLFVTQILSKKLHAYDLAKDKKSVNLLSTVDLYSGCDNLFLDTDGSVYSGCHPSIYQVFKSMSDCKGPVTSPSQILRIKFDNDYKTAAITESYSNDGSEISGSSVGVIYSNQMLIGTVCKRLLHCEFADPSALY